MKKITIKIMAVCLMAVTFALNSFGQSTELSRGSVPVIITESYVREYPVTNNESWYYYPGYSTTDEEWYFYNPSSTSTDKEPNFYVVEFISADVPYKIVYSKDGKRLRTYRMLNSNLPVAVSNAINKSAYKNWSVTKEKEEIIREMDKLRVYKVTVEKGSEKHALYYKTDGKLIKDQTIKSN